MSLLKAVQLRKSYGAGDQQQTVLHGASVELDKGQFAAIFGPSGSGKSTLLNICGLIEPADEGALWLNEQDLLALDTRQRTEYRRHALGFVFQNFNLIPVMTVADNIAYPLMLLNWSKAEIKRRVEEVLSQVELDGLGHRKPTELSGGQAQRVAIARALAKRPALIIADEPTANLDAITAVKVLELMRTLSAEQGSACLVATHDLRLLEYCDQTLHVEAGHIKARAHMQSRAMSPQKNVAEGVYS